MVVGPCGSVGRQGGLGVGLLLEVEQESADHQTRPSLTGFAVHGHDIAFVLSGKSEQNGNRKKKKIVREPIRNEETKNEESKTGNR